VRFEDWDKAAALIEAELLRLGISSSVAQTSEFQRASALERKRSEEEKQRFLHNLNALFLLGKTKTSYLSEKIISLVHWTKVLAEKFGFFYEEYLNFLERLLWTRLILQHLSGQPAPKLSRAHLPWYARKLESLKSLHSFLLQQLRAIDAVKSQLRQEYDALQTISINRSAAHLAPDLLMGLDVRLAKLKDFEDGGLSSLRPFLDQSPSL
jgi:hypothetical protein